MEEGTAAVRHSAAPLPLFPLLCSLSSFPLQGAKLQVLRQGDLAYAFRSYLDGKGGALREEVRHQGKGRTGGRAVVAAVGGWRRIH
jgi:hypothetical protein